MGLASGGGGVEVSQDKQSRNSEAFGSWTHLPEDSLNEMNMFLSSLAAKKGLRHYKHC